MTVRARLWATGPEDDVARFADFVASIAPSAVANLDLGPEWTPRDGKFVESLRGKVWRYQLPETLRRCESDHIHLSWPADSDAVLEVVWELYDDNIEISARAPAAAQVESLLSTFSFAS